MLTFARFAALLKFFQKVGHVWKVTIYCIHQKVQERRRICSRFGIDELWKVQSLDFLSPFFMTYLVNTCNLDAKRTASVGIAVQKVTEQQDQMQKLAKRLGVLERQRRVKDGCHLLVKLVVAVPESSAKQHGLDALLEPRDGRDLDAKLVGLGKIRIALRVRFQFGHFLIGRGKLEEVSEDLLVVEIGIHGSNAWHNVMEGYLAGNTRDKNVCMV